MKNLIQRITKYEGTLGRVAREYHRELLKLRGRFEDEEPSVVEVHEDLENVKQIRQILGLILNLLKFFS
jgi:hypothetical protein